MARRVNTRFVTILLSVVGGLILAALAAHKFLIHEHPEKYLEAGRVAMTERRWDVAVDNYKQAARLAPNRADIYVSLGEAERNLALNDVTQAGQDRAAWEHALEIDPHNMPALQSLLNFWLERTRGVSSDSAAEVFRNVRDYADRIYQLDPANKLAQTTMYFAPVQGWIYGVQTDQSQLDQDLAQLRSMAQKDPSNADLRYDIAQADIFRGKQIQRQSGVPEITADAEAQFKDAIDLFDTALKTQDKNAAMHYRSAQVFATLADADPAKKQPYTDRANLEIARAQELVQTTDPFYSDVLSFAGGWAMRQGHKDQAEKLFRDLSAQRPGDPVVQCQLATIIATDPKRQQEAIDLLQGFLNPSGGKAPVTQYVRGYVLMQLASIKVDHLQTIKDSSERKKLGDSIRADIDGINASNFPGSALSAMKLSGQLALSEGRVADAVQSLSRAVNGAAVPDDQVLFLLGKAYLGVGMTGDAEKVLTRVVTRHPDWVEGRLFLVRAMMRDDPDTAKSELAQLERMLPDNPEVIRDELVVAQRDKDQAKVEKTYARLPEATATDQMEKASVAMSLKKWDEAERLYKLRLAADPSDVAASLDLVQVYVMSGEHAKAVAAADQAVKDNPGDARLALARKELDDSSPDALRRIREQMISQNPNELDREMQLAALARDAKEMAGAEQHLKAAEKVAPNDPRVIQQLFDFYLNSGKLDVASAYAEKGAAINSDQAHGDFMRFGVARAKHDDKQALAIAQKLVGELPEFAQSWWALGSALQAQGQYDAAIDKYTNALERQGDNVPAYVGLIECSYMAKRPQDAGRYINDALNRFPDDERFRQLKIRYEMASGSPASILSLLEEEVNNHPDEIEPRIQLAQAQLKSAAEDAGNGKSDSAAAMLTKARDTLSAVISRWPDDRRAYSALAQVYLFAGHLDEGEKTIQTLAARDAWKDKPEPYQMLANLYRMAGRLDLAEKSLRTAFAKSNGREDVQEQLADLLESTGRFKDALVVLDAANSDSPATQRHRIATLMNAGQKDEAEASLRALLAKNPSDAPALHALWGRFLLISKNDLNGASDQVGQALAADPKQPVALMTRAQIRLRQSPPDSDAAVKDLVIARDAAPQSADVHFILSDAYKITHDLDHAITELEIGLGQDPYRKAERLRLVSFYLAAQPPRYSDAVQTLKQGEMLSGAHVDPELLNAEAQVWLARKEPQRALQVASAAVQAAPNSGPAIATYLDALLAVNNFQGVLDATDKMTQAKQGDWWVYLDRGKARHGLGDNDGAMNEFLTAFAGAAAAKNDAGVASVVQTMTQQVGVVSAVRAIEPKAKDDIHLKLPLMSLYAAEGNDDAAAKTADEVVAAVDQLPQKEQVVALLRSAMTYAGLRRPQVPKAYDTYKRALALSPDEPLALNNLACLLADNMVPPRPQEGLEYSRKAVELMRQQGVMKPELQDTLAWLMILNGQTKEGVSQLLDLTARTPIPDAYYHLAEGYLRLTEPKEAQAQVVLANQMLSHAGEANNPAFDGLKAKLDDVNYRCQQMMRAKTDADGK